MAPDANPSFEVATIKPNDGAERAGKGLWDKRENIQHVPHFARQI